MSNDGITRVKIFRDSATGAGSARTIRVTPERYPDHIAVDVPMRPPEPEGDGESQGINLTREQALQLSEALRRWAAPGSSELGVRKIEDEREACAQIADAASQENAHRPLGDLPISASTIAERIRARASR